MADHTEKEEHYLLRVQSAALARTLRSLLHTPQAILTQDCTALNLQFSSNQGTDQTARRGKLVVDGVSYSVERRDLPTIVECFKTYDKTNLIKSGDVGQVIVVPETDVRLPEGVEARDGLTAPMKNARKRRFRPEPNVQPALMRQIEDAILLISSGAAPEGYNFVDEEEEYVVSEDGKSGTWRPYQSGKINQSSEQNRKTAKKKAKIKGDGNLELAEPAPSPTGKEDVADTEEI